MTEPRYRSPFAMLAVVLCCLASIPSVIALATNPANPYSQVSATPAGSAGISRLAAARSKKFLVGSFPNLRQVAYLQLPDNVWRPLVIGTVTSPNGVAVDVVNNRLYVADPPEGKVWWYSLFIRPNGQLATTGEQNVAISGYKVNWMSVNSVGDLYFTGKQTVNPPQSSYEAVFRQDFVNMITGNPTRVTELYTRSNSGNPNPKVWMPSGIAVDSFYIYWGNQELGTTHGSLIQGPRQNVGKVSDTTIRPLSTALDEVRGMVATGTNIFYVTPKGVYGCPKSQASAVTSEDFGRVATPPVDDTNSLSFDPQSISWDGDGTLYFSEKTAGLVYSLPATNLELHNLTKFVDAPGIYGVTAADLTMKSAAGGAAHVGFALLLCLMLSVGS